ncbi:glycerol:H+ symporter [Blastomyces gilchristii SLH14081]|uniref:Glycerol:H+ symporter n=2 Tax=Blastomyces TaxID=229219 RepID=A0A179URD9_BLAGS|nr:glycerol:H+ symporter [Blastomyces gilchristii SLH14081]EGE77773.1 Glycerol:H+ symporter [Blastomyces dermatitidis ATCC 18188]OAT09789.1 glycerol:H+ symporter [Blastomyces gilchristii SLH14081]
MGLAYWFRRLYSLDTLDTRFVPSNTPLKAVLASEPRTASVDNGVLGHADSKEFGSGNEVWAKAQTETQTQTQTHAQLGEGRVSALSGTSLTTSPPRWNTVEFYVYYVVILTAVSMMFKAVYDVSKESHPMYSKYSHLLDDGWIMGRKVDNSDSQYGTFRDNIPYLALLLVIHPLLRRAIDTFLPPTTSANLSSPQSGKIKDDENAGYDSVAADLRLKRRVAFDYYFALVFIAALHGFSALKVLAILAINYNIATKLPRDKIPAATWIFNISILFANELSNGYRYADIARLFTSTSAASSAGEDSMLLSYGKWLDSYGGLIPRWDILFNLTVLRLISFNLDYYWSLDYRSASAMEKKQLDPSALSERDRVSIPAHRSAFNSTNYVAYALYSPLYLTGPIITFNDYISQQRYPPASITKSRTILYGVRFFLALLSMEVILHYIYVVAISQSSPNWSVYTPFQLSMLGYFNLHHIWLKLLLPWRFARLWALIDGIDPPENMVRCMSDNYSALAFWRGWHRSFNRWIVRYLYVPLGGGGSRPAKANPSNGNGNDNSVASTSPIVAKARGLLNFLLVFTFVALWHDINLRLLMWGWLITLFVLPEIIGTALFPAHKWRGSPTTYRVLCGAGTVFNILLMMAANLVGFALGLDGLKGLVSGIVGSVGGLVYLVGACLTLFVGVQVMFEIREEELRMGINMKC